LYFAHLGSGKILTEYGLLEYRPGDYLMIPKCIAHVILPDVESQFFLIENLSGDYREPDRGIAGRHAVYDPAQIEQPNLDALHRYLKDSGSACLRVHVKHGDEMTHFEYDECIFD